MTKRGFTLIELLVVIAIIALLVSILAPSLRRARDLALRAVCATNQRSIFTGANLYAADYDGRYPGGGDSRFAHADRNPGNVMFFARNYLDVAVAYRGTQYRPGEDCPHADVPNIGDAGWKFLNESGSPLHCPARTNWDDTWLPNGDMGYFLTGLGVCGYGNGGGYTVAYGYPRTEAPLSGPDGPRVFAMDVVYAVPWSPPYHEFYTTRQNHTGQGGPDGGNVQTPDGAVRWIDVDEWVVPTPNTAGAGSPLGYYRPISGGLMKYGYTGHWFDGLLVQKPDGTAQWGGSAFDAIFGY